MPPPICGYYTAKGSPPKFPGIKACNLSTIFQPKHAQFALKRVNFFVLVSGKYRVCLFLNIFTTNLRNSIIREKSRAKQRKKSRNGAGNKHPSNARLLKASPAHTRNVCVRVSACLQKTPNLRDGFRKRRLTNTLRRHRLADGQLSSLYAPLPSFSSFGVACVKLYDLLPPSLV